MCTKKETHKSNNNSSHNTKVRTALCFLFNHRIERGSSISVPRAFPFNGTPNQLMKMQLITGQRARPAPGEEISPNQWLKKKKKAVGKGKDWFLLAEHPVIYSSILLKPCKLGLRQFSRSILSVPDSAPHPRHLWNSSVNVVRGEDRKRSDPHMELLEVLLITLAFISAGWLKMIRVPELKLILRDWLSVTRVWHNRCKWSRRPGPCQIDASPQSQRLIQSHCLRFALKTVAEASTSCQATAMVLMEAARHSPPSRPCGHKSTLLITMMQRLAWWAPLWQRRRWLGPGVTWCVLDVQRDQTEMVATCTWGQNSCMNYGRFLMSRYNSFSYTDIYN